MDNPDEADPLTVTLPPAVTVEDALGGKEARDESVPAPVTDGAELRDGLPLELIELVERTDTLGVALAHLDASALADPAPGDRVAKGDAEEEGDDDCDFDASGVLDAVGDADTVRDVLGE